MLLCQSKVCSPPFSRGIHSRGILTDSRKLTFGEYTEFLLMKLVNLNERYIHFHLILVDLFESYHL